MQVFLHTYLDVVSRIVYPASCCKQDASIRAGLEAEATRMDSWKTKYGDYVRMQIAKCDTLTAAVSLLLVCRAHVAIRVIKVIFEGLTVFEVQHTI